MMVIYDEVYLGFFISAAALKSWQTNMFFFFQWSMAIYGLVLISCCCRCCFLHLKKNRENNKKETKPLNLNKQIYSINVNIKVVLHLKGAFNILEMRKYLNKWKINRKLSQNALNQPFKMVSLYFRATFPCLHLTTKKQDLFLKIVQNLLCDRKSHLIKHQNIEI